MTPTEKVALIVAAAFIALPLLVLYAGRPGRRNVNRKESSNDPAPR